MISMLNIQPKLRQRTRRGATIVLFAIFLPILLILVALVLELSYLRFTKEQLQAAADAGALAGASRLRLTSAELETDYYSLQGEGVQDLRVTVQNVVSSNTVAHLGPGKSNVFTVQANVDNYSFGDIVMGNYSSEGFLPSISNCNAVRVCTRFQENHSNGLLPLLINGIVGSKSNSLQAIAIAKVERPTLLPFLVYQPQWDWLKAGNGMDSFAVESSSHSVSTGPDGILETVVFPNDWDGLNMPPGNFGWFDIGSGSGTTSITRQVDAGPSTEDMAFHGGQLSTGDFVSGTTGLRSGAEVAFVGGESNGVTYQGILGRPRLIALYDYAQGQATEASFKISKFVMARVVFADLSGGGMGIVIQPVTKGQDPNIVQLAE